MSTNNLGWIAAALKLGIQWADNHKECKQDLAVAERALILCAADLGDATGIDGMRLYHEYLLMAANSNDKPRTCKFRKLDFTPGGEQ